MEKHGDPRENPPGYYQQGQPSGRGYTIQQPTDPRGNPPGYYQQGQPIGGGNTPQYAQVNNQQVTTGAGVVDFQNYMIWSIFSCFVFFPLGFVAIIQSMEAKNSYKRGDLALANSQARTALKLVFAAFGAGVVIVLVVLFLLYRIWPEYL